MNAKQEDMSTKLEEEVNNDSTDAEYVPNEDDDNPPPTSDRRRLSKRSQNWKHFKLVDGEKKIARCQECGRELCYATVSNLKKHLLRMHPNLCADADPAENRVKRKYFRRAIRPELRFRSDTWKYFTVPNAESKIATCRLCENNFSFSGISNLRKHLKRKHKHVLEASSDEEGEAEVAEEQKSPIWAYFKCLSQELKIACCLICKQRVDYSDYVDLTKHLSRKHPQIQAELETANTKPKKLMITSNGDIYEIDDDVAKKEPVRNDDDNLSEDWYNNDEIDALDTSVEYLEESLFNDHKPVPNKKSRNSTNQRPQNDNKNFTEIYKTKSQRAESEDSLEIFGKYMVSLLKKLPKYKADKLQADFVRQIMDAQMDDENTPSRYTCTASSIGNTRGTNTSQNLDDVVTSNSDVAQVSVSDVEIEHLEE